VATRQLEYQFRDPLLAAQRVLENLVSKAIEYSPGGEPISVRVAKRNVGGRPHVVDDLLPIDTHGKLPNPAAGVVFAVHCSGATRRCRGDKIRGEFEDALGSHG
jgi:signal transduction histidine kinase